MNSPSSTVIIYLPELPTVEEDEMREDVEKYEIPPSK